MLAAVLICALIAVVFIVYLASRRAKHRWAADESTPESPQSARAVATPESQLDKEQSVQAYLYSEVCRPRYEDALRLIAQIPDVPFGLKQDEKPLYADSANWCREVWRSETTIGSNAWVTEGSAQGGGMQTAIGGLLAGPTGAIVGHALSPKRFTAVIRQVESAKSVTSSTMGMTTGKLYVTTHRFIFITEERTFELRHEQIRGFDLESRDKGLSYRPDRATHRVRIDYDGADPSSYFVIPNIDYLSMALNAAGFAVPYPSAPTAPSR